MNMRFHVPAWVINIGICQEYGFMAVPEDMFIRVPACAIEILVIHTGHLGSRGDSEQRAEHHPAQTIALHR